MTCKRCGKALSNEMATCPFCGAFLHSSQIDEFVEMKKEKAKDLRPKLISEQYGMEPIQYEKQEKKKNPNSVAILALIAVVFVFLLITLFIIL